MEAVQCVGCQGDGTILVRVYLRVDGKRRCYNETEPCPICHGTGSATAQETDAWWQTTFGERYGDS